MSRARKTWVSDAYALRQAAFMQLPPAKIERPFRKVLTEAVACLPRGADEVANVSALKQLRTALRPLLQAAKRGDGATVRAIAWRVFA